MAKVDIIDIRKQKVGELEVDDRLLSGRGEAPFGV